MMEAPAPVMPKRRSPRRGRAAGRGRCAGSRRADRRSGACARAGRRRLSRRPAPAPQKPLVDENDWRVTRPATRPVGAATEPVARPVVARPAAGESRSPNLFQRITGAFAAPKADAPAATAAPVEPSSRRAAPSAAGKCRCRWRPSPRRGRRRRRPRSISTSPSAPSRARDDDDLQIPAFLRRQAN